MYCCFLALDPLNSRTWYVWLYHMCYNGTLYTTTIRVWKVAIKGSRGHISGLGSISIEEVYIGASSIMLANAWTARLGKGYLRSVVDPLGIYRLHTHFR